MDARTGDTNGTADLIHKALDTVASVGIDTDGARGHITERDQKLGPNGVLKAYTLGGMLFSKGPLIQLSAKDTINRALAMLQERNIIGAPVYNCETKEYVGFVTAYDIMTYLAFGFFKAGDGDIVPSELHDRIKHAREMPIESLCGTGQFVRFGTSEFRPTGLYVYEPTTPICKLLSPMMSGVGRVLVRMLPTGRSTGEDTGALHEPDFPEHKLLSETDVLRFFTQRCDIFRETFGKKLGLDVQGPVDSGRTVVSVDCFTSALTAYRRMFQGNTEAAAVCDASGRLAGTLSASDLRGIRLENVDDLHKTAIDFVGLRRFGFTPTPVWVTAQSTLLATAVMMLMASVHRVWVVDDQMRPISVVRTCDVIGALALAYDLREE